MGAIYRRTDWHCTTCRKRLARTVDRDACNAAGHDVEKRQSNIYWIKYTRAGMSYFESSGSKRKGDAKTLLQDREGDIAKGKPVTPKIGKLSFDEAAADLLADYTTNGKRSLAVVERRVRKHLTPYFAGRRMANVTTTDVRSYIARRQTTNTVLVRKARTVTLPDGNKEVRPEERRPASNAEINRELALLKRMFTLSVQAAKLLYRPHIPMLKENNVRTGFFERELFESVLAHLPTEVRPVIEFAYITGWRINSEVLPLQWRQVDFDASEVRLDAGTTKNGDGRVFPMTAGLRTLLQSQRTEHDRLKKAGHIEPSVFFRMVAQGRGGEKKPRPIVSFTKAWKSACRAAGCPGRIPHDFRRTAVRNLDRAGVPRSVAMAMVGHKTESIYRRYRIVDDRDLRDAVARLDAATPHALKA
ncbi:MAG TPA: tyrosine-type recombinase/integrase [Vicinamibacterales bacterium]|nr:tyrosine-type recombinase/integrase [Vicinamibacterales bacterium]